MKEIEKKEFGAWVKQQREKKGMTQVELAAEVGLSQVTISTIEKGTVRSLGEHSANRIKSFLNNGGSRPAINLLDQMNVTGLEHLLPALRRLGRIALQDDFRDRVEATAKSLGIHHDEAAATVFLWELKKL